MPAHATSRLRAGTVLAVAAILATLVSGCGSSDDDAVRSAVRDFLGQVGEQDYTQACEYLDQTAKARLSGDCAGVLKERYGSLSSTARTDLRNVRVNEASIHGSTASVADRNVRSQRRRTVHRRVDGKDKTTTRTTTPAAPDLTSGDGFTLVKSGGHWLVNGGI